VYPNEHTCCARGERKGAMDLIARIELLQIVPGSIPGDSHYWVDRPGG
jgi:hypothetical protein